jgi:hypothetical protein
MFVDDAVTSVMAWVPSGVVPLVATKRLLLRLPVPANTWPVVTSKVSVPEAVKLPAVGSE